MQEFLSDLIVELENVISKVNTVIPSNEPLSIVHSNWSFPGITKNELVSKAQEVINFIECLPDDSIGDDNSVLIDYKRRLRFLSDSTIQNMWVNAAQSVPAYLITLDGLKNELNKYYPKNHSADLQKAARQIRALEARLKEVEPKMTSLASMVERIENAFNTAEQLPADMDLLNESREKIKDIINKSSSDAARILAIKEDSSGKITELELMRENAKDILQKCETAYAASTSVGLAAAFSERSNTLNNSMWFWIIGLIIALSTAAGFSSYNIHSLLEATGQAQPSTSVIVTRLFLSALSICGPIWFAWLATKQIGQRFRLSEDYAFKASISRAYEGFRSEASRIDKNLEAKLLASALSRLDEQPLRLVETETHGSPYLELISSDALKEALKVVPGFSDRIKLIAEQAITAANDARRTVLKSAGQVPPSEKVE